MAMKQTQLEIGDAAGKTMQRKAWRCVKKQPAMREIQKFLHSSMLCGCALLLWPKQCWQRTTVFSIAEQCLHSVNASFLPDTASRLGVGLRLGVDIAKTAELYCRMSHSAINSQRDEEAGGMFVVIALFCASNHYVCCGPASQEAAGHLPADREEWINSYFALLAHIAFTFPIKLSLSKSISLLAFLPLPPNAARDWMGVWLLAGVSPPQSWRYWADITK